MLEKTKFELIPDEELYTLKQIAYNYLVIHNDSVPHGSLYIKMPEAVAIVTRAYNEGTLDPQYAAIIDAQLHREYLLHLVDTEEVSYHKKAEAYLRKQDEFKPRQDQLDKDAQE